MYPEEYTVDEATVKSALVNGQNVLAVECHNVTPFSSDMTLICYMHAAIKDNSTNYFPTPYWFVGGNSWLHTNFKLSQTGETVYLSDPSDNVIDQMTFLYTHVNHSTGRTTDGGNSVKIFDKPTPDSTNNNSLAYSGYANTPLFSLQAGFYNSAQVLSLSTNLNGNDIYYTIDGSAPIDASMLYTSPINIDSTTVIRAVVYDDDLLHSDIESNTYVINEASTLPAISVSTDPDNLWDWDKGIYVLGPDAENVVPYFGANFWQDWEIPVHVEYFDKQGALGFEQDIGFKISGNYSRSNPQKSFKLIARGAYGKTSIDYQIFPDKPIASFKQVVVRDAGNDWNNAHMRDALSHKMALGTTHNIVQSTQQAVVFINGEYWGVYNIREKINEHYIAENFNVNPDSIDLLQYGGSEMVGTNQDFVNMSDFILYNNMSIQANYDSVKNWLDIDNFVDYFTCETYLNNWDWLGNNVRFWREQKTGAKWRYIFWDLDLGLGATWPFYYNGLDTNLNKWYDVHSKMMVSLLQNTDFRNYFINRYADLMNTIFLPSEFSKLVYAMRDTIDPEMQKQFDRWGWQFQDTIFGRPGWGDYNNWRNTEINRILDFINNRPPYARDQLQAEFNLPGQVPVTLNVYPPGAGYIKMNTIYPKNYPWGGIYYDSVPIQMIAIPNPGYEFAYWQSNVFYTSAVFNDTIGLVVDTPDNFTAYFFGAPDTNKITFSEINYNSNSDLDAGDWVELYNYGNLDVDISGWQFRDKFDYNYFTFPQNTILKKNKYLVLYKDDSLFFSVHPNVTNAMGPFNFNLSGTTDELRLFDQWSDMYLEMTYSNLNPWPQLANANGGTLELLNPAYDLNDPYNWFDGCLGGSPGGAFIPCDSTGIEEKVTGTFNLNNYPNPFSNGTFITFNLPVSQEISIYIYNLYGNEVLTLFTGMMNAGRHNISILPETLSAGVYFCVLSGESGRETRMMQVIR